MDDSERSQPATPPQPVEAAKPIKGAGTHRTQRLATALRDNLKRRKAAGRAAPVRPSN
jgi:hypothetical protein